MANSLLESRHQAIVSQQCFLDFDRRKDVLL